MLRHLLPDSSPYAEFGRLRLLDTIPKTVQHLHLGGISLESDYAIEALEDDDWTGRELKSSSSAAKPTSQKEHVRE